MSYDFNDQLQTRLFDVISGDSLVASETGGAVFDAEPAEQILPEIYVRLGNELVKNASSQTHRASKVQFEVSIFAKSMGFVRAKRLASHIAGILSRENMALDDAELIGIWFHKSQSYRLERGNLRLIRLWFKAMIDTTQTTKV